MGRGNLGKPGPRWNESWFSIRTSIETCFKWVGASETEHNQMQSSAAHGSEALRRGTEALQGRARAAAAAHNCCGGAGERWRLRYRPLRLIAYAEI